MFLGHSSDYTKFHNNSFFFPLKLENIFQTTRTLKQMTLTKKEEQAGQEEDDEDEDEREEGQRFLKIIFLGKKA